MRVKYIVKRKVNYMATPSGPSEGKRKITEMDRRLGERLRELRQQHHFSLSRVATETEVTKPHISSIEKGIHRPSVKLLAKLEDLYGVTPGALFSFIGQDRPMSTVAAAAPAGTRVMQIEDELGGIIGYKEAMTISTLATAIHTTERAIDILDVFIAEDLSRLAGPFLEAAGRDVRMRVILLHPDLVRQSMGQVKAGASLYRAQSADITLMNIATLRAWYREWQANWTQLQQERQEQRKSDPRLPVWQEWNDACLRVYLLPFMPMIEYHRFDDRAFVGFFLHVEDTRQTPRLEVQLQRRDFGYSMRTPFGRTFWDEFVYLWDFLEKLPSARVPLGHQSDKGNVDAPWTPPPLADYEAELAKAAQA